MRQYELMYILRPELEEEAVQQMNDKIQEWVKSAGAEVREFQDMGKRRLAYEIEKLRDGYYAVVNFQAEPSAIGGVDRHLKYDDQVLRYMIVKEEDE